MTSHDIITQAPAGSGSPPGDPPKKKRNDSKRIFAKYNQGTLIKVRLKEGHRIALASAQTSIEEAAGMEFSSTILLRRSLERYCKEVQQLTQEGLQNEARQLLYSFR